MTQAAPCAGKASSKFILRTLFISALALMGTDVRADIVGPYTVDANTLHLWHLDELAVPAVDAAPGGTNLSILAGGATLGNASFMGFGTALNTSATTNAYLAPFTYTGTAADNAAMTYADPTTGAFSYEAIIRVDFDPAIFTYGSPLYILTAENLEAGSNRPFQWSILPNGTAGTTYRLRFLAGGSGAPNNITVPIPTTGPDAIAQGKWYHVAVTFSGGVSSGTLKQYWTLLDPTRVKANCISTNTMSVLNPKATGSPAFQIGNVGRGNAFSAYLGLIDEVRMSGIERSELGMMFNSSAPSITSQPAPLTAGLGSPFSLTVVTAGSAPLAFQWRTNGVAIQGATSNIYTVAAATLADDQDYDVVVTNVSGAVTSSVVHVTVRTPLNLSWIGSASPTWDFVTMNWDSNGDTTADAAFTSADKVTFDDRGSPIVDVSDVFAPSATVASNSTVDYILTTSGSGGISGFGGLIKTGTGTLTLDIDNTYSGSTVISGGMLVVGAGFTRGSLGTGSITNNAILKFDRTDAITVLSSIAGTGDLLKENSGSLNLSGTNTFTGNILLNRGNLTFGPGAIGNAANITMTASGGAGGTILSVAGGAVIPSSTTLTAIGSGGDNGNRLNFSNQSGSNIWNAPIILSGDAPAIWSANGGTVDLNGPISGPTFNNVLSFRGTASGSTIRSTINLPSGGLQKDDAVTYTLSATNGSYLFLRMLNGTLQLGGNNAIATNSYLRTDGGILDLAGFNQVLAGLSTTRATPLTTITNSSATSDSRLTISTAPADAPWVCGGVLADAGVGARKVSLSLLGGATLVLTNANSYSGDTTINAGTLALSGIGAISNSTPIFLAAGTTLDASGRADGTLTIQPAQTVKGDGVFNVVGTLVNNGTIELKANKSGAALSNDRLNDATTITFGGTLKLVVSASPALTTADSFKLFSSPIYSGSFASITPTVPGPGLAWDTSTLATDGTLRINIAVGPATNSTNIVFSVGNNAVELTWPTDHIGWRLQAQTNPVGTGLNSNWADVSGSTITNHITSLINTSNGSVFFRLVYP